MASNAIVTPNDLALFQGGDAQTFVDQATAEVRGMCGWHVTPVVTETLTLVGEGAPVVMLPSLNVSAVSAVTVDGVALDVSAYRWSMFGALRRVDCWWSGFAGVEGKPSVVTVTLTHGYQSAPDLAGVILARASRLQENHKSATRVQAGPFSMQFADGAGFTSDEADTIRRYRIPVAP